MSIIKELKERKILKDITNLEKFENLNPKETGVYVGFDPSAKSLHLGNYILISVLKRFKEFGFNAYALVGGATGMIGDPSFRDSERVLLNNEQVLANKENIRKQLESFGLKVIDNYNIYKDMNVLEFLRDAGKLVNVSYMLSKESVQKRIERGLSFTEFSYQLLQGYDFLSLYKSDGIKVQVGGSDQWGNITTGLDMISKIFPEKHNAVGLTVDLLTDENGNKIGKSTGGGSLWLDKTLSSPFNMYQYLVNQPDSMVEKLLMWLTFLPVEEIRNILNKHFENPSAHYAQKILADEIVKDIFGKEELKQAQNITKILFDKNFDVLSLNKKDLEVIENYLPVVILEKNSNLIDSLIEAKIISSKREAREFIQTNALKLDNNNIDENSLYMPINYEGKYAIFKKGKKQTILIKTK
ncbi:tyrosyl tRNA synthetase [Mycoplasmopsis maculosa]|uniref:Tyrosine--tRNA ligase n=1 Tax=Mycoplasmopsis maculosa TaxID=114885 RepID=A0A449B485_9BACT|nr:tyrosine--tRNA ligase [Mycoplasmopsis maculosa]VEU75407.1 tyrosyl tRNA synthetase [Mycoplasmopsis maculosa]